MQAKWCNLVQSDTKSATHRFFLSGLCCTFAVPWVFYSLQDAIYQELAFGAENEISSLCSDISNPLAGEALSSGPLSGPAATAVCLSGKRDSNSRPSAWEADALPTELFPQEWIANIVIFRKSPEIICKIFKIRPHSGNHRNRAATRNPTDIDKLNRTCSRAVPSSRWTMADIPSLL